MSAAVVIAGFTGLTVPSVSRADAAYNDGTYSNCPYSQGCPTTPTPSSTSGHSGSSSGSTTGGSGGSGTSGTPAPVAPTTGQLPSGLDYSINLQDGQVIQPGTYTVVVTPLNSQASGATFQTVEVLLDGQPQATLTPTSTGTVYWPWDTAAHPASRITFKITDSTGQTSTREFNVRIAAAASPDAGASGPFDGLRRLLHAVPPIIVYLFPWLLFLLLLIAIAIMTWQVQREVAESERLKALLAREKALTDEKTTFVSVASHYLRTPLTLISGGRELAAIDPATAGLATSLQRSVEALRSQVESLLSAIINHAESAHLDEQLQAAQFARVWLRATFILPLVAIGLLVTIFNLLFATIGEIALPVINVLLQVAAFVVLAIVFYVVFRHLVLRHRERREAQALADQRRTIDDARNQLISDATAQLGESVTAIQQSLAAAPAGQATTTLKNGLQRFQDMLETFAICQQVKTAGAATAPAVVDLADLVTRAVAPNAATAQAKNLQVIIPSDHARLASLNPELLQRAMASVVGNAVAYSPAGTHVMLETIGGLQADKFVVRDEGPGLPPAQIQELFQPFFRAEGALNFSHEGMGFSLYLDKLIMHYLGGDIAVEPGQPRGLTVTLSFPA